MSAGVRGTTREVALTVLDRHAATQPLFALAGETEEHVFTLRYSRRGRETVEDRLSELTALHRARELLGRSSIENLAITDAAGRIVHDEPSIRAVGRLFKLRQVED